jgi:hypothetical protein
VLSLRPYLFCLTQKELSLSDSRQPVDHP